MAYSVLELEPLQEKVVWDYASGSCGLILHNN